MSGAQEVPRNTQSGRKFLHAAGHEDPISSSESEGSDTMSTTSPVGHSNTPKGKNSLRNKVSKIKRSTRSLFRKAPKGGSDVVNETPLKSDVITDELVKQPDAKPVVSDAADAQGQLGEVREKTATECPTIALIAPLPESKSEILLPFNEDDPKSPDEGHSYHKSIQPEVTRTHSGELVGIGHTEPMELTEPESGHTHGALGTSTKTAKTSKVATDTTPSSPASSETSPTSPYVFGGFTCYQLIPFTLAAIGICVVAAPQTYRLLRLR